MKFRNANQKLVIGLSGVAGVGKDTFYRILRRYIKIKRYALADILKEEVKEDCIAKFDIDPTNCTRTQKNTIRDYLVEYGKARRKETKGRYFIDKLNKEILNEDGEVKENICITDVRYDEWREDEGHWIQEELGGYIAHIERGVKNEKGLTRNLNLPANADEEFNIPRLLERRDFIVTLDTYYVNNEYELTKKLEPFIKNFIVMVENKAQRKNIRYNLEI